MHSESDNLEMVISYESDEVIKELLESLKKDMKIIYN